MELLETTYIGLKFSKFKIGTKRFGLIRTLIDINNAQSNHYAEFFLS